MEEEINQTNEWSYFWKEFWKENKEWKFAGLTLLSIALLVNLGKVLYGMSTII